MSLSDTGHQRSMVPIGVRVAGFVTSILREWHKKPEDRLVEDLERLALSAPHLLTDIGFARDAKASSSAKTIWCKGSLRVAISSRDGSVSVLQR